MKQLQPIEVEVEGRKINQVFESSGVYYLKPGASVPLICLSDLIFFPIVEVGAESRGYCTFSTSKIESPTPIGRIFERAITKDFQVEHFGVTRINAFHITDYAEKPSPLNPRERIDEEFYYDYLVVHPTDRGIVRVLAGGEFYS